MQYIINNCQPESLFHFFEQISAIPRSSGNEKQISDMLVGFAKEHGLSCYQDEMYNVIIKKNGSVGKENSPAVILQGHIDMVCEKDAEVIHNFQEDALKLRVVDGQLMATGTTLGADNGIAVAMMLAVLEDNSLNHPPIECVFTVQEETGLAGAITIDGSKITGRTMINLDSEEEGVATVSCAGGMRIRLSKPIALEKAEGVPLRISITGLNGGHSGMDISKGLANSNKLLGRILYTINEKTNMRLININGGNKDNAIPREAAAEIMLPNERECGIAIDIANVEINAIQGEFAAVEENLFISVARITLPNEQNAVSKKQTEEIINCIYLSPNGVLDRNEAIGGFVVRSINLGVIRFENGVITITYAPRSSVASLQQQTKQQLLLLSKLFSFEFNLDSEYPGWSYSENSPIREVFIDLHREQYGSELKIENIHAGLECGLFGEKLQGLDAIAVGPSIYGCHTPKESLDLASCERFYKLLVGVLNRI